jgi:glycosyltransferase involved in cell wall biosynthesis
MSDATVGVIIPAYNAERFLAETLDSLRGQTFSEWEAVVVDDGSTDATREIAESYSRRDSRIKVLSGPNVGLPGARNKGMAVLSTPYLAFLDADDLWLPELLEKLVATALAYDVALVACHNSVFEGSTEQRKTWPTGGSAWGAVLSPEAFTRELKQLCFFVPSGVMLKRAHLHAVGGFDETLRAVEDWDLWLRLAEHGSSAFALDEILFLRRHHESNLSSDLEKMFHYNFRVMKRHSVDKGRPGTDFRRPARLNFRNTFTLLGDTGELTRAARMFQEYREHDRDGYACQVMALLERLLPSRLFWLLSRYVIIPLAWHLE